MKKYIFNNQKVQKRWKMAYFSVQLLKWPWKLSALSIMVVDFALLWFFLSKIYVLKTLPADKSSFRVKKMLLFDMLLFFNGVQLFFSKVKFWKKSLKNIFFNEKILQKHFFHETIYVTELHMKYQGLNLNFQGFIK